MYPELINACRAFKSAYVACRNSATQHGGNPRYVPRSLPKSRLRWVMITSGGVSEFLFMIEIIVA